MKGVDLGMKRGKAAHKHVTPPNHKNKNIRSHIHSSLFPRKKVNSDLSFMAVEVCVSLL